MKNYRSSELVRAQNNEKHTKYAPVERKGYSPSSAQHKAAEYDQLAKRAKEQLKQFQNKRKVSPQNGRQHQGSQQKPYERTRKGQQTGGTTSPKTIQHSQSHKLFNRNTSDKDLLTGKDRQSKESPFNQKSSADGHPSPSKKNYIDSNEYKKLHDKLDVIETKITDMKRNLQRKKEEKQKHQEQKIKDSEKRSGLKDLVTKVAEHTELHTFNSNPYSPRHSTYYVSELVRAYKDQQSLAREHLLTSLNILKMLEKSKRMNEQELKKAVVDLPRRKDCEGKKTVVFDLDETLIHCNDSLNPPYDVKLPIKFPTGEVIEAGINIRPYTKQLLRNLSKHFQIILFTASHSCYANVVIDHLDPKREWVSHRLFRQHCYLSQQGMYVKDLRVINRDPKTMVLVDNAAYSYAYQLSNGIPILPYYHGHVDFQLKMLEEYLMKMMLCSDMREINEKTFRLHLYKNYYSKPQKLVQQLYINNQ